MGSDSEKASIIKDSRFGSIGSIGSRVQSRYNSSSKQCFCSCSSCYCFAVYCCCCCTAYPLAVRCTVRTVCCVLQVAGCILCFCRVDTKTIFVNNSDIRVLVQRTVHRVFGFPSRFLFCSPHVKNSSTARIYIALSCSCAVVHSSSTALLCHDGWMIL